MKTTETAWFHTMVIGLMALGSVLLAVLIAKAFDINNKILDRIIMFGLYMPMVNYYLLTRTKLGKK